MIVAGIGCRRGATTEAVIEAVTGALARSGLSSSQLLALAIPEDKRDERGIIEAARKLSLHIKVVLHSALEKASGRTLTTSPLVQALKGVPSVAETAALAAAGEDSRLLAPRLATPTVTCALAEGSAP